jgi:tetratricopeptide (TPR) repeat protein
LLSSFSGEVVRTFALFLFTFAAFGQAKDAETLFQLGVTYSQQGDHAKARDVFLQALRLQPNSVAILNNLGVNALQLGNEPQAADYFRKALLLQPTEPDAGFNLGLIELKQRRFAEAARSLKRVSAQRPHDLPVLQGLLEAELGLGSREAAEKTADRLLNLAPADPGFYFRLAATLAAHRHFVAALAVLERARGLWPDSSDVAYNLAIVQFQAGGLETARNLAEAAVQRDARADLHHLLGDIYERQNLLDKAVQAYQAAVRLDPEQEDYHFALGYEFLAHHNFDLAEQVFSNAVLRLPQAVKPRLGLAAACFARGKYPEAIATLKAATEMSPPSEIAYLFFARTFLLLADQKELFAGKWVVETFQEYVRLKPNTAFPYYVYAVSLSSSDITESVRLLEKVIQLDPNFADAHLALGKIFLEQARYKDAIRALETAVRLNPASTAACFRLSRAYQKAGNAEKAQAMTELFLKRQKQQESEAETRRKEIVSFLYTLK